MIGYRYIKIVVILETTITIVYHLFLEVLRELDNDFCYNSKLDSDCNLGKDLSKRKENNQLVNVVAQRWSAAY